MDLVLQATIGFVAGVVGGLLGVGGSTIIIPALILYLSHTPAGYQGSDQHLLQAVAMICNVFIAGSSIVSHIRARIIMSRLVRFLIVGAMLGSLAGVYASNSMVFARENGRYLAMLLAAFLGYVAVYDIIKLGRNKTERLAELPLDFQVNRGKTMLVGLGMGFVSGLLGIGGGALVVPAQQMFLRIPLRQAIANSAITIVFISSLGAMIKNGTLAQHGFTVMESIRLAMMIIPAAMVGSYLGGRLTYKIPGKILHIIFIVFMVSVAAMTFIKALPENKPVPSALPGDHPQLLVPDQPANPQENGRAQRDANQ